MVEYSIAKALNDGYSFEDEKGWIGTSYYQDGPRPQPDWRRVKLKPTRPVTNKTPRLVPESLQKFSDRDFKRSLGKSTVLGVWSRLRLRRSD